MDPLSSARRPDLVILNKEKKKRTYQTVGFAVLADPNVKQRESENRDNFLHLARELKKYMEHKRDRDIDCNWCAQFCNKK